MAIRLVCFKHWLAFKCLMAPLGHVFGQPTYIKAELDGVIKARYENQNLFFFLLVACFLGFPPQTFYFCFYRSWSIYHRCWLMKVMLLGNWVWPKELTLKHCIDAITCYSPFSLNTEISSYFSLIFCPLNHVFLF